MEEKEVTYTQYTCSHCGHVWTNRKYCEECEEAHQLFKESEKWPKWHWYKLYNTISKETKFIFVKKITRWLRDGDSCSSAELSIYDTQYNTYYNLIGKSWKFVEILSIEDCYEQEGLVPQFYTTLNLDKMPDDIREQYWKARGDYLNKEAERLNEAYDKWDLISEVMKYHHPEFFENLPLKPNEQSDADVVDPIIKLSKRTQQQIHDSVYYGPAQMHPGPLRRVDNDGKPHVLSSEEINTFFDNILDDD